MLSRQSILKSIVIFFVLVWVVDAEAVIYKWKDENGKTHFTDDSTKVPEAFRKTPFLKNPKTQKEDSKPEEEKAQVEEDVVSENKGDAENEKEEDDKQQGLTEAQRSAIEAVLNFFKEDIHRYDEIYTYLPGRSKFRSLKQAVAGSTPQKQALLEQVSQHELPLLESVSAFLKTSIAEDKKTQKDAMTYVPTRKTRILMNRLKSEAGQEAQFLEKLTALLDSENDS